MDKYEYKLRLEEIKTLNKKGRFQEAAQVADTVDWNKVRNVSTLCVISDVYKINRRFEDAKAMLLLANEKNPNNRRISYALCDLTIKMGQVVEAVEYYKEFVQQAPNDNSRYILLYKIYEAQEISLEERIAVLKEYKKREYNEKWAYELAFLYHRIGLATECIEECDQLILWFGEGKYVIKAMELKQLYAALSPAQQQSYDRMTGRRTESEAESAAQEEMVQEADLQAEASQQEAEILEESVQSETQNEDSSRQAGVNGDRHLGSEEAQAKGAEEELDIHVKPMDMGEYNTINLQAALAESMKEVLEPDVLTQETTRLPDSGMRQIYAQSRAAEQLKEYGGENAEYLEDVTRVIVDSEELTNGVTGQLEEEETERVLKQVAQQAAEAQSEAAHAAARSVTEAQPAIAAQSGAAAQPNTEAQPAIAVQASVTVQSTAAEKPDAAAQKSLASFESGMDNLLAQEYDGQISLALPEEKVVEKQITGQMNIEDVLREWERMKDKNAKKRKEETREWMLQQTGSLFVEFDQQRRDGVLEQLERESAAYEKRINGKQTVNQNESDAAVKTVSAAANAVSAAEDMTTNSDEADIDGTMIDDVEIDDAEVEELEEIEEIQEENWDAEDAAAVSQLGPETAQEAPRPANAAARAVMAASGMIAAEKIAGEETAASAEDIADKNEAPEEIDTSSTAESMEMSAQSEQPADTAEADTAEDDSETGAEADTQPEAAATEQKGSQNPEDTAALHVRIKEQQIQEHMRHMSREEKEMFSPYVPTRGAMRQLVSALDSISLSAFTGNVIVTGAPGSDTMGLARNMIRSVRNSNNNFSGKVAKISGDVLNEKSAAEVISKIAGGALIVERAGKLSAAGAAGLAEALNQEHTGVIVFALDTKKAIERLMDRCAPLADSFTARFDIAALDSSTLVKYGCQYAYNQEFAIDELGRLALHTRIEDMQTSEHAVTVEEVREIIDEAIDHATRFSPRHFLDIILHRRYDEDDMIILRERDFI